MIFSRSLLKGVGYFRDEARVREARERLLAASEAAGGVGLRTKLEADGVARDAQVSHATSSRHVIAPRH